MTLVQNGCSGACSTGNSTCHSKGRVTGWGWSSCWAMAKATGSCLRQAWPRREQSASLLCNPAHACRNPYSQCIQAQTLL